MVRNRRKLRFWHIPLIFVGLCAALLLYFFISSLFLHVEIYTIKADIDAPIRIVQLTDLHNAQFGRNNMRLIEAVRKQSPDLIVMTGDMLNRDDPDLTTVKTLISGLAEIAPVYYGYGNHEAAWESKWGAVLHEELSSVGAVVLNNEFVDVEVNGSELRIGGYMGYYWQPHMMAHGDQEQIRAEREFYAAFQDTDQYKILLNHIPTQWVDWKYINKCPVDLVFCGHYHGGVIRIPFLDQGVYAPYVGWFPPYTKGVYSGSKATCVLSAGLGIEHSIPRLNNPPEIVVVELAPKT